MRTAQERVDIQITLRAAIDDLADVARALDLAEEDRLRQLVVSGAAKLDYVLHEISQIGRRPPHGDEEEEGEIEEPEAHGPGEGEGGQARAQP